MKTTTFSAFKAIAIVALICIIGLTKSKAQNGPMPGQAYQIDNITGCTLLATLRFYDNGTCNGCSAPMVVTLAPGTNWITTPRPCGGVNLFCNLSVTITDINGTPISPGAPLYIDFWQPTDTTTCTACTCTTISGTWSQFSATIN